ncbi:hypothetical protein CONCODRAFT_6377 [Conidiobolus coronatus NRRL 28638]|uniref:F-box domain-containing protein n=1 Tax=Conidiobolus coronatus (strain ATCC 28846 / CBS 209.66 / NRRL 28638) TaxID=796925 RepID=A0A137P7N6_CONC2|nr:hypothetical protein CONCODRAFT_6377 [Conidiobolus coronatus NRRL 28638]|eukprot:KXN71002.1 hypothetical protein CONCODRAFT_6377 [Conidiobolus coronatus NRRL 28638]
MITPFLNHYSSLKRLQINYCENISFDDFITILKRNPQIKKLSFSADYLVNNQFVIFEYINQLSSLHITKGNLEIPEISFFLQNLKEVIIEAKLSNNSFFNVVRSNQHLVEIYFHIELPQEVYQEILNLKYIKIISFRSVNPRWVRRLSKIPTIERLTWIKKPSIGYIVSIISRACINYNMQYIKGKFSIIF